METTAIVDQFLETLNTAIQSGSFIKLVLSKPPRKSNELKNLYARLISLKQQEHLGFTLRYTTKDITKNYNVAEGIEQVASRLGVDFLNADLFTTNADISIKYNKKRKASIFHKKPSLITPVSKTHDKVKKRLISTVGNIYLQELGIIGKDANLLKSGQRKYRQINKFIEIIDSLLRQAPLSEQPHIVDMGSGKGYLTFALYDFLSQLKLQPSIVGIELRQNLVDFCNALSAKAGFKELSFLAKDIHAYEPEKIDMLIALHACDIATDMAIAKGIKAGASIIVVAPCCHKQIRREMKRVSDLSPILKHGILEERQAELITDGIRALLLEANGYTTKVFEFISTEHTSKNLMITAIKGKGNPTALKQVAAIKQAFGIDEHYLESLL